MIVVKKAELLAPAGNVEKLKTAIHYGADAVFLGGKMFNLRAGSNNFSDEELEECVQYAHERGKRVYVTLNIIPHNEELEQLPDYVKFLEKIGVDAVIVADLGVFQIVKENTNLAISVSTQASNTNWRSVKMWKDMGAKRVVLAREISLENIMEIRQKVPDIELEVFVHGAMCMSVSGRCLLSNYMTGRDANRGDCAQSCRWKYSVVEETRPGEYMPVYEDERGTYIFNSKDLCMIQYIPEILDAGIDSLKIEGRMKTALYVATVARTYRKAIDDYQKDPELYKKNMPWYLEQISNCTYRQFTTGFFFGKPDETTQIYDSNTYVKEYTYLGIIGEVRDGLCRIEQRNKFSVGEIIEIMKPNGENVEAKVERILNEEGEEQESAPHSKQVLYVALDQKADKYDILRRAEKDA